MKCKKCKGIAVKNGRQSNGKQRYHCKECKCSFQRSYSYKAYKTEIKKTSSLRGCYIKLFQPNLFGIFKTYPFIIFVITTRGKLISNKRCLKLSHIPCCR